MDSSASFSGEFDFCERLSLHFSGSGFHYILRLSMRRHLSTSYGVRQCDHWAIRFV